ncbi:serine protease 27-like [Xiphophorus maculatus]|uniref:Serine protease 27-like n=1 Tax=Xiphophorus maculatus TaxID=8083 RepID=A0A3B5R9G0_XIPMA|nr:serine protease 27-like [Xiphophorus maculatus]
MALQGFAWGITVMIALFFKGGDSQPACASPPINSRIIGGQDASPGRWPWHVAFTIGNSFLFCQGSLITEEWVLTAAQCERTPSIVVLHFGIGEVTRGIDSFHCHPNHTYYGGNICLVKLSAPVNFTDYIRPVCLAAENSTFYDGTSSWVTGFSDNLISYPLQEIDVSVLGNRKCNCSYNYIYIYNYIYNYPITEDLMCAGSENGSKTESSRDEGAALVTKKDSIWVQSGIVSLTWPNLPTIYTRVSQYQKWITDTVTGMDPGFVTYTSPGIDRDLNYTCPPPPTTTQRPDFTTQRPDFTTQRPDFTTQRPDFTTQRPDFTTQRPDFTTQHSTTDDSIFGSGETLIPVARVFPLSALVLFVHLFVGGAGN